jgi:hypothetical protein
MKDDPRKITADTSDEIIREVREIREAYSARHGHDVRTILRKARERASESRTIDTMPGDDPGGV